MSVKEIQKHLYKLFITHKYHLYNSYIYNWECDYFSTYQSGYHCECEIKVSRSDFFADFKKEKHKIFESAHNGKTHFIYRNGLNKYNGTVISKIDTFKIHNQQPSWRLFGKPDEYLKHQEYL